MVRFLLTISITFGLIEVSFSQADIDSVLAVKTIKELIKGDKQMLENDSMSFVSGNIFSINTKHKYIRLLNYSGTYIQVYSERDNYSEPIFSERLGWMNYVSDSLFDINGDKIKDLAIHWYPSSGCCLADIYDCYIFNPKSNQFSSVIKIPNPTFFPDDSKTFSMSYGHPGETRYFELKWNKSKTDTLIIYEWKDRASNQFIVTNYASGEKTESKEPPEFLEKLYGFEWFMMK